MVDKVILCKEALTLMKTNPAVRYVVKYDQILIET